MNIEYEYLYGLPAVLKRIEESVHGALAFTVMTVPGPEMAGLKTALMYAFSG